MTAPPARFTMAKYAPLRGLGSVWILKDYYCSIALAENMRHLHTYSLILRKSSIYPLSLYSHSFRNVSSFILLLPTRNFYSVVMDRYSHIIVALFLFSTHVKAVQYVNTTFLLPNVTAALANALTVDISGCDAAIRRMRPGLFWDLGSLQAICTPTCKSALSSYESGVIGACQGQTYDTLTTAGFIPFSTIPDILFYQFNRTCLTSNGEFCNYEAALAAGIAPDQSNLSKKPSCVSIPRSFSWL